MLNRPREFLRRNPWVDKIRRFMLSPAYPAVLVIPAILAYCTTIELVFGTLMVLSAVLGLIVCRDLRPLIPPLLMFTFLMNIHHAPAVPTFSDYFKTTWVLAYLGVLGALVVLGVVAHFLLWGGFSRVFTRRTRLTYFLIPLALGLLLNGLLAPDYVLGDLVYAIITLFCWVGVYLLFVHGLERDPETVDYFCHTCLWVAVLLFLELIYIFIVRDVIVDGALDKTEIMFGWGINNNYGGFLTCLIPPIFYLSATKKRGWIYFPMTCVILMCIVLSLCRSGVLVGAVVFAVCLIAVCCWGKHQLLYRTFAFSLLVTGCLALVVLRQDIAAMFSHYLNVGLDDSLRFEIWEKAYQIFRDYPIFGGGFHSAPFVSYSWFLPGFCHNTIIQLFCAGGLVCGLSYLVYRGATLHIFFHRMTGARFFLGMLILALLGVSLLDNHLFNIYPAFFYCIALALGEHDYDATLAKEASYWENLPAQAAEEERQRQEAISAYERVIYPEIICGIICSILVFLFSILLCFSPLFSILIDEVSLHEVIKDAFLWKRFDSDTPLTGIPGSLSQLICDKLGFSDRSTVDIFLSGSISIWYVFGIFGMIFATLDYGLYFYLHKMEIRNYKKKKELFIKAYMDGVGLTPVKGSINTTPLLIAIAFFLAPWLLITATLSIWLVLYVPKEFGPILTNELYYVFFAGLLLSILIFVILRIVNKVTMKREYRILNHIRPELLAGNRVQNNDQ